MALALDVEKDVLQVEDIETSYTKTGQGRSRFGRGSSPDRIASITTDYYDQDERPSGKDGYAILNEVREVTKGHSGILVQVESEKHGPPIGLSLIHI